MVFSYIRKYIFVAVPKTGSTSITKSLGDFGSTKLARLYRLEKVPQGRCSGFLSTSDNHISAAELQHNLGDSYQKYFTFAFVRNPWDRFLSNYFHMKNNTKHPRHKYANLFKSFDHYAYHSYNKFTEGRTPTQQSEFLCNESGEIIVDFVGKLESVNRDFRFVTKKINLRNRIVDVYNKGRHKHYTKCYNDELITLVGEIYEQDIKLFNYNFNNED